MPEDEGALRAGQSGRSGGAEVAAELWHKAAADQPQHSLPHHGIDRP